MDLRRAETDPEHGEPAPVDVALHRQLTALLGGVVFPADREKLLWHLERDDAGGLLVAAVASLPANREFHDLDEVEQALRIHVAGQRP